MLKLKRYSNIYRYLVKYNKSYNLASIESLCDRRNEPLTFHDEGQQNNSNGGNRSRWKNDDMLMLSSIGIGLVFCSTYINNSKVIEKKFFRSVQYGIELEVKK